MALHSVFNLLKLSVGLGLSTVTLVPHAYAALEPSETARPASRTTVAEFVPTDSEPLNDETIISTTGGRYFQPPVNTGSPRGPQTNTGTRSGGSCASSQASALSFSSLGPRSMPGLTTRNRPEFVWYMTDAEAGSPILFRLLSVDENNQSTAVASAELSATPGLMRYQLPETAAPLNADGNYLWQIIVQCESNGSSRFLASTLSIKYVEPSTELTTALTAATNPTEKAIAYGQAGIWYDAFALVTSGTTAAETEARTGLLQDLAMVESEDELFSATLSAIAEQTASEQMSQQSSNSNLIP